MSRHHVYSRLILIHFFFMTLLNDAYHLRFTTHPKPFLEIQRRSFLYFLNQGLSREFSLYEIMEPKKRQDPKQDSKQNSKRKSKRNSKRAFKQRFSGKPNLYEGIVSGRQQQQSAKNGSKDDCKSGSKDGSKRNLKLASKQTPYLKFHHAHYRLQQPKRTVRQCVLRRKSYSAGLFMPVELVHGIEHQHKSVPVPPKTVLWFKMLDLPLMTKSGHFIMNGVTRVILNQVVRSPGIHFQKTPKSRGRHVFHADFIAQRGTWLRLEAHEKEKTVSVNFKTWKKIPIITFLYTFGLPSHILNIYLDCFRNPRLKQPIHGQVQNVSNLDELLLGGFQTTIDKPRASRLEAAGLPEGAKISRYGTELFNLAPKTRYVRQRRISKGEHADLYDPIHLFRVVEENLKEFISQRFFNLKTYDLSLNGRWKLNKSLGLCISPLETRLTANDVLFGVLYLLQCVNGTKTLSDIDDLQNRNVKSVSTLLQNQLSAGLFEFEEKMADALFDFVAQSKPKRKLNRKILKSKTQQGKGMPRILTQLSKIDNQEVNQSFRTFFGTNPLSQFLDETNALAELTHKRRLSSLGLGGITRETATMAVRSIHPTHYGRICPIETPEGKNAGLVNSLTTYGQLNDHGLIETPFLKTYKGYVINDENPMGFSSVQETRLNIASGDLPRTTYQLLPKQNVAARMHRDYKKVTRSEVDVIAITPTQMVSVATSLIPFLEHNDGNRALMGSNMQRQAVATLHASRPIVGTGFESRTVANVGTSLQAESAGLVAYVDGQKINVYHPRQRPFFVPSPGFKPTLASFDFAKHKQRKRVNSLQTNLSEGLRRVSNATLFFRPLPTLRMAKNASFMHCYNSVNRGFSFKVSADRKRFTNKYLYATILFGLMRQPFDKNNQISNGVVPTLNQRETKRSMFGFSNYEARSTLTRHQFNQILNNRLVDGALKNATFQSVLTLIKTNVTGLLTTDDSRFDVNQAATCSFDANLRRLKHCHSLRQLGAKRDPFESAFKPQSPLLTNPYRLKKVHNIALTLTQLAGLSMGVSAFTTSPTRDILKGKLFYPLRKPCLQERPRGSSESPGFQQRQAERRLYPHLHVMQEQSLQANREAKKLGLKQTYFLEQVNRSNQETYRVQRPRVKPGQWVQKGDLLAENVSSCHGELSVGQNLFVGYTPWEGYNFEDAILISQRLVSNDIMTSLHIERYEITAHDTVHGHEEITRNELPMAHFHDSWSQLDERGIVKPGSWVKKGDTLVGRVTPIKPKSFSRYEVLLFTVLQRYDLDFRETSLVLPHGEGYVIHVEVIKNTKALSNVQKKPKRRRSTKKSALEKTLKPRLQGYLKRQQRSSLFPYAVKKAKRHKLKSRGLLLQRRRSSIKADSKLKLANANGVKNNMFSMQVHLKKAVLKRAVLRNAYRGKNRNPVSVSKHFFFSSYRAWFDADLNKQTPLAKRCQRFCIFDASTRLPYVYLMNHNQTALPLPSRPFEGFKIDKQCTLTNDKFKAAKNQEQVQKDAVRYGRVYVYVAHKRKIQVGDKLSGRHGNKGIVSRILPSESMPYLPDGTPLDVVLNPLGVPSRMNVGQIFECLLGLAGAYLNQNYKLQPFDEIYGCEASRSLVYAKLYEARLKTRQNWLFDPNFPGKVRLFDGRTGQCFEQPVTVGKAYILKLIHLVDEKIHARATEPYSLITQQPLRGRAKNGGQRVGEMEVWALEGFGASYTLQEILTFKSDDMVNRKYIKKAIGANVKFSYGTPESFRVLMRELQGLCLQLTMNRRGPAFKSKKINATFCHRVSYDES